MTYQTSPQATPTPRATYRLQLTKDFRFDDVAALAWYLSKLGVSHVYLSPVLKARPGSTHGYDVVDHTLLNPELGTLEDFRAMAATLKQHGLGIILDIVPNHMGIGGAENPLWLDVLECGKQSRFADWFDINWSPRELTLHDKVLVPFLGTSYAEALADGEFILKLNIDEGSLSIWVNGHRLPLALWTYSVVLSGIDGDELARGFASLRHSLSLDEFERCQQQLAQLHATPDRLSAVLEHIKHLNSVEGRDHLHTLIDLQNWRAAKFTTAADDINYRRFFIVSDLAALRAERDDVFEHSHKLIFDLIGEGLVDGLRVDHIDGLYDPKAYCIKLRQRSPKPIYLVVEKILAPHEQLPLSWGVQGTTGYEFAGIVNRLLSDSSAEPALTKFYDEYVHDSTSLDDLERKGKFEIIDYEMSAELDALTDQLLKLARQDWRTADLTRNGLRSALRHTVAAMSVYRTYLDAEGMDGAGRRNLALAIAQARKVAPAVDKDAFSFLETVMAGEWSLDRDLGIDTALRIQQYTGPVMAKGLEDTALYLYNRLIALSDVGEKPDRFSTSVAAFHDYNVSRQQTYPHGLLTTSSHDTKRGEDVRARILTLTDDPARWIDAVTSWDKALEAVDVPEIDPNHRYYLYQLLLGAWPVHFNTVATISQGALDDFRERFSAAMLKSVRESRQQTNWSTPNADYEKALETFVARALSTQPQNRFLELFSSFAAHIGEQGARKGITETVLKLTVPGVPDIYQGAELWEQSMVDPDNRRAVDFDARIQLLNARSSVAELMTHWHDGAVKQAVTKRLLGVRQNLPYLFSDGSYEPVKTIDEHRGLCSFVRKARDSALFVAALLGKDGDRADPKLAIPNDLQKAGWKDVITDREGSLDELVAAWATDQSIPLVAVRL